MKIYVKKPLIQGAWLWINEGYKKAWEHIGFQAVEYTSLSDVQTDSEYDIMAWDWDITGEAELDVLRNARRAYLFAQPHKFPEPWGSHPNWISAINDAALISGINASPNIHLWTFCDVTRTEFYCKWKPLTRIPFGLDNFSYKPEKDSKCEFDICYIGGWANNGFNEKREIMLKHFAEIKKLNLKCGIFINRGISVQDEANILFNSKISINIHDAYTRTLGINYNERTFKSLGLTGFLISDKHKLLESDFPDMPLAATPQEMASLIAEYMDKDLSEIKEENRTDIIENHTYINRVNRMLELC